MPLVKNVFVRLQADGAAEVKAQLDGIAARAKAIGEMDPTIKVSADGKAAMASLAAMRLEFRALRDAGDQAGLQDLAARLKAVGDGADSSRLKMAALRAELAAVEAAANAAAKDAQDQGAQDQGGGNWFSNLPMWAKLTAALAPLAPIVLGIGGAFAGAAAGVAAFGLIAGPVIKNAVSGTSGLVAANQAFDSSAQLVHTAITTNTKDLATYTTAQQGLTAAQRQVEVMLGQQGTRWQNLTQAQRNAAISLSQNKSAVQAMLPAQADALKQLIAQGQAYNQLTPAQRAFGAGLSALNTQWQNLQQKITPALLNIAAGAMRQLGGILHQVGQIALAAAPGVGQLVHQLLQLVSQVFAALAPAVRPGLAVLNELVHLLSGTLVGVLHVLVGALTANEGGIRSFITTLGTLLGGALKIISGLMTALQPLTGAVSPLMGVIRALVPVILSLLPVLTVFVRQVALIGGALAGTLVQALHAVLPGLSQLMGTLAQLLIEVLGGKAGTLQLVQALLKIAVALLPVLPPLLQLIDLAVKLVNVALKPVVSWIGFLAGMLAKLVSGIAVVIGWVARVIAAVLNWITNVHDIARAWDDFTGFLAAVWNRIVSAVQAGVRAVVSWFTGLPGRIMAALASLGAMMFSAGQHAVQYLINGLGSMAGSLGSMVGSLASKVAGFFGLSPAKEGPLSGGGAPFIRGQHFAADIAAGIAAGTSAIRASASRAAAAAAAGASAAGGYGAAPAAGGQRIVLEFAPGGGTQLEQALWAWLVHQVRVKGGAGPKSAQIALGQGTH